MCNYQEVLLLHILITSLALLHKDLSSELIKNSQIFINYLLFSLFNFNLSKNINIINITSSSRPQSPINTFY